MTKRRIATLLAALALVAASPVARAQQDGAPTPVPVISVSASSTATVPNDRLHAWFRVEVDNPSAAAAAAEVNQRVARILAKLKALPDAQTSTSGYTSQQIVDKARPTRWRVTQTIKVEGGDFAAIGDAAGRLQAEDGAVLSGLSFGVSDELRKRTQDAITQQAIAGWRARAEAAAKGFGAAGWRPGRVTIQAGDGARPYPMMARAEMQMAAAPAPVPLEAGSTEVTVAVTGEAILDPMRR